MVLETETLIPRMLGTVAIIGPGQSASGRHPPNKIPRFL